jgi:Leucine-rich repeat (LRR) protein
MVSSKRIDVFCTLTSSASNEDRFLIQIDLSYNRLEGDLPASIYSPAKLQVLNLAGNQIQGKIPSELFYLSELRVLDLSDNAMDGPLSADVYYLTTLESLILNGNQFSGPLPWSIGYLSRATIFHIQDNNFTGALPWSFNQLTNVTSWDLSSNSFDNDAHLPTPLCPHCKRSYLKCALPGTCGDQKDDTRACVRGYLLACTTPRSYTIDRDPNQFEGLTREEDVRNRYDRTLDRVPEQCSYRFV